MIVVMAKLCEKIRLSIAELGQHRQEVIVKIAMLEPDEHAQSSHLSSEFWVESVCGGSGKLVGEYNQQGAHGRCTLWMAKPCVACARKMRKAMIFV